jgi:hypothetical protein
MNDNETTGESNNDYKSGEGNSARKVFGGLFLVFGLILTLGIFTDSPYASMVFLWPLFVLIPGIIFEAIYFSKRENPALLVPGGILIVIGLLFIFEVFTFWRLSAYTWPVYLVAVAIGLFQLYAFGPRKQGVLFAALILSGLSVVFVSSMVCDLVFRVPFYKLFLPIALICLGLAFLFKKK